MREEVAPVAYRVRTFARLVEASDSGIRELIARGDLKAIRVGNCWGSRRQSWWNSPAKKKSAPAVATRGTRTKRKRRFMR